DEGRPSRDFRSAPERPPRGFDPPPRGFEPPSRSFDGPMEATAKTGFLFIDGEYIPPPYEIRYADESVTVNGRKLTCVPPPPPFYGYGRGFGGPPRTDQSWRSLVTGLKSQFDSNGVAISFADQPLFQPDTSTSYDLL